MLFPVSPVSTKFNSGNSVRFEHNSEVAFSKADKLASNMKPIFQKIYFRS